MFRKTAELIQIPWIYQHWKENRQSSGDDWMKSPSHTHIILEYSSTEQPCGALEGANNSQDVSFPLWNHALLNRTDTHEIWSFHILV